MIAGTLSRMTEQVAHRGPDGSGLAFFDARGPVSEGGPWRVGLGHRRLSILDLSEAGAQPMNRGDVWITYNGEVFNYLEVRSDLEALGHAFVTGTDTEVILAAYQQWGTAAFERLVGMWGLVIVDLRAGKAIACRDRMGIKPLHVLRNAGLIAFVSEIKQLRELPGVTLRHDPAVTRAYLLSGWEQSNRTFYDGVERLPAGTFVEVNLDTLQVGPPRSYWSPEDVSATIHDPSSAAEAFGVAFEDAVRVHLRSDVPVGCALSGGLDSSAVAHTVREVTDGQADLHTFTATFPGHAIDERGHVDTVVDAVKARSHFVRPTAEALTEDLSRFVWIHDEPVGSISQYAAYTVARLTRRAGVPVTLNGQGGDEVLSGYWETYFMHLRSQARPARLPGLLRHLVQAAGPGGNRELLGQAPFMARRYLARLRPQSVLRLRGTGAEQDILDGIKKGYVGLEASARRVYDIRELFLPRLLKWDDRNFMAFSVEGRYPFLDHRLIEVCLSFGPDALYHRGWAKEPLRRAFEGRLPPSIVRRRDKVGFETPQEDWLSGPLRGPIESMLEDRGAPIRALVSPGDMRAVAAQVFCEAPRREAGQVLFRLFNVDTWLRTLG